MGVTVTEDVSVKMGTLVSSVFDNVGVLEDVGRNLLCLINVMGSAPAGLKLWSKLESASDITSPTIGSAGSEFGSPTYPASEFGNGILSDANNEGCTFPTGANSINLDKGTIEFWGKLLFDEGDSGNRWFFSFLDASNGGILLQFQAFYDDFRVLVLSATSIVVTLLTEGQTWDVNDLMHFAVTWDREGNDIGSSKTIALYINGSEVASSTTTWSADTVNANLYLGTDINGNNHSDLVIDNIKVYNTCKIDFSDRNTESPLLPGEGVSLAESIVMHPFSFIDVYDSPSLTEYLNLKYPGDRSFSTFDNVSVAEDIVSRLLPLISVSDTSVLAEYLRFTGRLGDVDVYDSVTLAESFVVTLINLISEYEEVTVAEVTSALASIAGISLYEAVSVLEKVYLEWWLGIVKDPTTWSDVDVEDTEWSDIIKDDTEWSDVR